MRLRGVLVGGWLATLGAFCTPGLAADRNPCETPPETAGLVSPMPQVAAVLKPGATLRILAIGSASLFGPEATLPPGTLTSQAIQGNPSAAPLPPLPSPEPSETAFPQQMVRVLENSVPGLKVELTVRGGRSMSAADLLELLQTGLAERKYQLVIWQTGTVEAVRGTPPGDFAQTLSEGAALVQSGGADLVLIDPQWSRFLQTNSNLEPYEQALQQVASLPGVTLFHRFDLMRNWAGDGQIDLERTPKSRRKRAAEQLHACLGSELARVILSGARA